MNRSREQPWREGPCGLSTDIQIHWDVERGEAIGKGINMSPVQVNVRYSDSGY